MSSTNKPKILIFDIETSPNIAYCWRAGYKLSITPDNIVEERQIICIGYKWLGEAKTYCIKWDYSKGLKRDRQLLIDFLKVIENADEVVAHNGKAFDKKWIQGRLLYHGLSPLPKVKILDTLLEFRSQFNLNSKKLGYITEFIGVQGKMSTGGFQLWKDVMAGKVKALTTMVKYCKQDVTILESVYEQAKPFLPNTLNLSLFNRDSKICPSCGSSRIRGNGYYYTEVGKKQRFRCTPCGASFTTGKSLITKANILNRK